MKQLKIDGGIATEVGNAMFVTWQLLKLNPVARNDDEILIKIVKSYCNSHGLKVPTSETITRARRKIQYVDGLYPASPEVQANRRHLESQYSKIFGD